MIGKTELKTKVVYDLVPSGLYTLQNLGGVKENGSYNGKPTISFVFTFAILDDKKFVGAEGGEQTTRGRQLRFYCSDFFGPKSKLMGLVSILDPKVLEMTDKQKSDYNLDSLEGMQINGLIGRNPSKKDPTKIYNNITSFEPATTKLELLNPDDMNVVPANSVNAPETAPEEEETVEQFNARLEEEANAGKATTPKSAEDMSDEELEAMLAAKKAKKAAEEEAAKK